MIVRTVSLICVFALTCLCATPRVYSVEMSSQEVIAIAQDLALKRFVQMGWDFRHRSWIHGTFWAGVVDLSTVCEHPDIDKAMQKLARSRGVRNVGIGTLDRHEKHDPLHADDMCIGQAFLHYALKHKDDEVSAKSIQRVKEVTDYILSEEAAENYKRFDELKTHEPLTWSWIDALFMAAPLHAHLTEITGDQRYLDAMFLEWKRVSDRLYDTEEHLYYRDKSFLKKKSRNGKKVFWSRGNGWVMGAFAHSLPYIPEDHPQRAWLVLQFQEMATKMAAIQQDDGSWPPSLIDFKHFPYSEMSATAFNCFAIAWGINNNLLDDEKFRPAVAKAWAAMLAARNEDGFMGYVQGVGAQPAGVGRSYSTLYGDGAFLSAAVQVSKMAPLVIPDIPELKAGG